MRGLERPSRDDRIGRMPINLLKTLQKDVLSRKLLGRRDVEAPGLVNAIRLTAEEDVEPEQQNSEEKITNQKSQRKISPKTMQSQATVRWNRSKIESGTQKLGTGHLMLNSDFMAL